jgi:predicted methyltransferase
MRKTALFAAGAMALLNACGGSPPPDAFPPHLDIPIPPDPPAQHVTANTGDTAGAKPTPPAGKPAPPPVESAPPADPRAIVAAPDRDEADKKLDAARHPAELLAFLGLAPGMRVAELGAGGGYTTELLARAVGPKGKVWAQNSAAVVKFAGKIWAERLTKPVLKKVVVRVDREFDAPLPADAKNLDAVVSVLFYHDTVWMNVNRDKMNKAVFAALKPGGEYVVVDHAAAEGHGTKDAKTLHRIEESAVTQEIEKAGFKRSGNADFLRNPSDAKDWNDAPGAAGDKRGTSDRFVLKFIKPQPG